MKTIIPLFLSLFLTVGLSAQDITFNDWDVDGDGVIEQYEFTAKFVEDVFDSWTPQDEYGIVEDGFFENSYTNLDSDGDQMLSDEEWMVGYNYVYEDYLATDDMNYIDANEDGTVTYHEYYDALYDTDFFSTVDVDSDNYISRYELAYFAFDNWDYDNSNTLSRSEFRNFDWYYLDI